MDTIVGPPTPQDRDYRKAHRLRPGDRGGSHPAFPGHEAECDGRAGCGPPGPTAGPLPLRAARFPGSSRGRRPAPSLHQRHAARPEASSS